MFLARFSQDDTDVDAQILNVSFSIRDPTIYNSVDFYRPQYVKEKVYLNRQTFAEWARVEVADCLSPPPFPRQWYRFH